MHFTPYGWSMIIIGSILVILGIIGIALTLAVGEQDRRRGIK